MKRNPITLITGIVLVIIFGLMLFAFQVRRTEVAVVTTFGKYSRSINEPGLVWRLPWPIQKVYKFDNRIRNLERGKFEQTTTRDAINVLINVYVGWRIADPKTFMESFNGDDAKAEQTLEPLVRNVKNGVIGQRQFKELVSTNQAEIKFDEVEREMLAAVREQAGTKYGIQVELLGIKQVGLPESITAKVFERMRSERMAKVKEFQSEGDKEARIIRGNADSEATKIISDARNAAIEISGKAEAQANKSYRVFQEMPELANFLFGLRALEQSLKDRTTLVLDQQTPPFNMLREGGSTLPNPASPRRAP